MNSLSERLRLAEEFFMSALGYIEVMYQDLEEYEDLTYYMALAEERVEDVLDMIRKRRTEFKITEEQDE